MCEPVHGSLSVGYHCLSHSHGHLLCRVTHKQERQPPEYKSDWAVKQEEGQERWSKKGRLQALVWEIEAVN